MFLRLCLLASILLFISCGEIERNNPEDPDSPKYNGGIKSSSSATPEYNSSSSVATSSSSSTQQPNSSGLVLSSSSALPSSSSVAAISSSSVVLSSSSATPSSSSVAAISSSSVVLSSSSATPSSSSVAPSSNSFEQDPCSQTAKLNANAQGAQSWNGTKEATVLGGSGDDAYGVEAWTEAGGNATKLTWFGPNQGGGYAFRAEWTNSTDYLGRFGYFWGQNGKKWNNLGDLCVDYNYTRSNNGTGGSYSYIGVYGWTIGSNNSAEYYIVEDWFGNGQQQANNLGNNCQTHGIITVDNRTYQVVTCIRPQGSGCLGCNNQAFGQVFSIRQGMATNSSHCGTISIKKHFEEWTKMGGRPAQYIYDKTYESKFLVETQGGTGWFEASYMKFSRTGGCGVATP